MDTLTTKQRKVLKFIETKSEADGAPPTYREIADHLGVSVGSAQTHVEGLRRKGLLLNRPTGAARPLARRLILRTRSPGRRIPILGRVPAGPLAQAFELSEDSITLDPACLPSGQVFGLQVRGDSMIEAGILENDIVIVRVQAAADPGDIVVARIGDDATVKRLVKSRDRYHLKPENPSYDPIPADDAEILGKVVGLFRKL
ncbi:repressor LexA [bacterium]|nr:repressor LexA [bacterium]